jgi:hypothetical protein
MKPLYRLAEKRHIKSACWMLNESSAVRRITSRAWYKNYRWPYVHAHRHLCSKSWKNLRHRAIR